VTQGGRENPVLLLWLVQRGIAAGKSACLGYAASGNVAICLEGRFIDSRLVINLEADGSAAVLIESVEDVVSIGAAVCNVQTQRLHHSMKLSRLVIPSPTSAVRCISISVCVCLFVFCLFVYLFVCLYVGSRISKQQVQIYCAPTRVSHPYGISIGSTFSGLTDVTNRHTHRLCYSVCSNNFSL